MPSKLRSFFNSSTYAGELAPTELTTLRLPSPDVVMTQLVPRALPPLSAFDFYKVRSLYSIGPHS